MITHNSLNFHTLRFEWITPSELFQNEEKFEDGQAIFKGLLSSAINSLNDQNANDFDYASQCAIGTDFARSHSKDNTPDQCCGDYPTRFPFMSKDGIHKCCGSKIFNPEYTVKFLKSVWSLDS